MNLVLLLILIPLAGAIICAMVPVERMSRAWAFGVSLLTLGVAALLFAGFDTSDAGQQLGFNGPGIANAGFSFTLGLDSISLCLVLLTAGLTPLAIVSSHGAIRERQREYYAHMLALLAMILGAFVARDALLFYVFFELTLIPAFFIIGIWGGSERRYAAGKFFLYTFAGSIFTLAAIVYVGLKYGTFDINSLSHAVAQGLNGAAALTAREQLWVLLGFVAGFAVKTPLFPLHTWQAPTYREGPISGTVVIAGALAKLGSYGLLRLALPLGLIGAAGHADHSVIIHLLGWLCLISIIYGALIAWVQTDLRRLLAFSSLSHMGFCILGLLALNVHGVSGSILYMVNHGITTGALFLLLGMIYCRHQTLSIDELSGLAKEMPRMSFFFVLFVLASIGLPLTNGFVSEFLTVLGAFTSPHLGIFYGSLAATGIVLGAVYMLYATARVIFGPLRVPPVHVRYGHGDAHHDPELVARGANADIAADTPGTQPDAMERHDADKGTDVQSSPAPRDLSFREVAILIPLAIAVIWLGVMPTPVLRSFRLPVQAILRQAPLDRPADVDTPDEFEQTPAPSGAKAGS